jgi:vanillate O-demethylase monooxygenase subunit
VRRGPVSNRCSPFYGDESYSIPGCGAGRLVWYGPGRPQPLTRRRPQGHRSLPESRVRICRFRQDRASGELAALIENLLDITHFFPLHEGNIGDRENSEIPVDLIDRVNAGNREVGTSRAVQNYRLPPYYQRWFRIRGCRSGTHARDVGSRTGPCGVTGSSPGELGTPSEKGYVLYHTTTCVDAANLGGMDHGHQGGTNVAGRARRAAGRPHREKNFRR